MIPRVLRRSANKAREGGSMLILLFGEYVFSENMQAGKGGRRMGAGVQGMARI